MEHHGFFDRFDQLRGISPLAPAVNTLRDCYEGYDYALAKMKVAQLFALAFYRQQADFEGETKGRQSGQHHLLKRTGVLDVPIRRFLHSEEHGVTPPPSAMLRAANGGRLRSAAA